MNRRLFLIAGASLLATMPAAAHQPQEVLQVEVDWNATEVGRAVFPRSLRMVKTYPTHRPFRFVAEPGINRYRSLTKAGWSPWKAVHLNNEYRIITVPRYI